MGLAMLGDDSVYTFYYCLNNIISMKNIIYTYVCTLGTGNTIGPIG